MFLINSNFMSKTTFLMIPLLICRNMSEIKSTVKSFKKPQYDWRSKKRVWEERRSDRGEGITNPKQAKTDEAFERIKRKKYAILLGYSGLDYFGMQRNPSSKTIEEDLFKALLKADYITQEAFKQIQSIGFQRAARTDKGVSAARQVVSLKLPESISIEKINEHLPEVIRVFAAKRVTKGFNSKSQCSSRTYLYMFPTIALSPLDQSRDQNEFRSDEKLMQRCAEAFKKYEGTKNFHNFTSKKKCKDPSANRYMISCICEPPFIRKGVEFAVMKVKGQSFMLHQIRKMVGLVFAVVNGAASEDIFTQVFSDEKVNLPKAPGLGLVLDYVHYDNYNKRYGSDGIHEVLEWNEVDDIVNDFKEKFIYPTIVDTEINEKSMVQWLEKLEGHRYDVFEDQDDEIEDIEDEADTIIEESKDDVETKNNI